MTVDIRVLLKGGEGSGNFGHAGRPGEVGGSAPAEEGEKTVDLNESTIKDALATMEPSIAASYTSIVHAQWQRLQSHPVYSTRPYAAGNDFGYFTALNAVKPSLAATPDEQSGKYKYLLDEKKLEANAKQYAQLASQEWHGKLSGKVGELTNTKLIYGRGAGLSLSGMRDGHQVNISQQMIVNVSGKGTIFNQFPARITVNGKSMSEAAYKKQFGKLEEIQMEKTDQSAVELIKSLHAEGPKLAKFDDAVVEKGGPGSGNFGHAGRPGEVGGSSSDGPSDAELKQHPMYTPSDMKYFKDKGYTNSEIKAFWDRDKKAGKDPVHHQKVPDVVGVISDPDFYRKGKG